MKNKIIEKYKDLPQYQLLYVDYDNNNNFDENSISYLAYKNKDQKIIFIDEKIYKDPPNQFENYICKELNNELPNIKVVKLRENEIILQYMFQEHDINSFDWKSLNPDPGYYLCYYRKLGKNEWNYNFDIFSMNVYGHFINITLLRHFDYKDIMNFVFLEKL